MKLPAQVSAGPLSRIFTVEDIAAMPGGKLTLKASPEECAALAKANDLPAVGTFEARLLITTGAKGFHVGGDLRALTTQTCVVTLEPFDAQVSGPVDARFVPVASPARNRPRDRRAMREPREPVVPVYVDPEDDPPEPIIDGKLDLGATAAEFFALALDPYPRKPDAAFAGDGEINPDGETTPEEPKQPSPFAALARLRKPD